MCSSDSVRRMRRDRLSEKRSCGQKGWQRWSGWIRAIESVFQFGVLRRRSASTHRRGWTSSHGTPCNPSPTSWACGPRTARPSCGILVGPIAWAGDLRVTCGDAADGRRTCRCWPSVSGTAARDRGSIQRDACGCVPTGCTAFVSEGTTNAGVSARPCPSQRAPTRASASHLQFCLLDGANKIKTKGFWVVGRFEGGSPLREQFPDLLCCRRHPEHSCYPHTEMRHMYFPHQVIPGSKIRDVQRDGIEARDLPAFSGIQPARPEDHGPDG